MGIEEPYTRKWNSFDWFRSEVVGGRIIMGKSLTIWPNDFKKRWWMLGESWAGTKIVSLLRQVIIMAVFVSTKEGFTTNGMLFSSTQTKTLTNFNKKERTNLSLR